MKQFSTKAIVLARTNYGEADRILTLLTPTHGKVHVIARGVRKIRSKLAGGIELLSQSEVSIIEGRGELDVLASTRLIEHYGQLAKDLKRSTMAFNLLRCINKTTEDSCESDYYRLAVIGLHQLNLAGAPTGLTAGWLTMQLLKLHGTQLELFADDSGTKLQADDKFDFRFEQGCFVPVVNGGFRAEHIKLLRILAAAKVLPNLQADPLVIDEVVIFCGRLGDYYLGCHV